MRGAAPAPSPKGGAREAQKRDADISRRAIDQIESIWTTAVAERPHLLI